VQEVHRFAGERYRFDLWFLDPPRELLAKAIADRTHDLFARGLVEEVEGLVRQGYREAPAMRSVGYRQALAVLDGQLTLSQAEADTERQTRAYAKRQRTWFRKESGARFVAPPYDEVV
jgi:tRNA dimethylallyltransferase